jgi:hypothetical protein
LEARLRAFLHELEDDEVDREILKEALKDASDRDKVGVLTLLQGETAFDPRELIHG